MSPGLCPLILGAPMADSALKLQLTEAMKDAMRAKDKARLGTVRLALAEVKRIEVDERIEPDDARVLSILEKMIRQRRESIRQYESAGRNDLADIPCMQAVGCGVAVADAQPEVLQSADLILRSRGGHGAIRELGDLLFEIAQRQMEASR
jgi:hypothetical protein